METDTAKKLVPTKARVTKMQHSVESLKIVDEASQIAAAKILSGIKSVADQIKEKKEEITKPMNEALRAARALFSPLEKSCAESRAIVDSKVIAYNRKVEEARKEKEEKITKRVEKGTMKMETAAKKLEEAPEVKTHVVSDKGSVTIKKVKKFEVKDLSKLPLKYHLANEPLIRKEMNAGNELTGVHYFEDEQVAVR